MMQLGTVDSVLGSVDSGLDGVMAQWRALRERQWRVASSQFVASPPFPIDAPERLEVDVSDSIRVADEAAADAPILLSELLVGVDLVVKGAGIPAGVIIEAVCPVWTRFLEELERDAEAFFKLNPWQTEELIAGAWRKWGFAVTLTPRSGDKGRDVIATRDDIGSVRFIDQVRQYRPGLPVDAEAVRAMYGVLNLDQKASKAYITTTSTFAPGVYKEFEAVMPTRLELRNGKQLREWLTQFLKK